MLDIRRVSPSSQAEVTALFALIAELAEYERLSVTTTPEALSQALEASSGTHAALARWEGHPVGYLVWYRTFSTFRAAERLFPCRRAEDRPRIGRIDADVARLGHAVAGEVPFQ